MGKVKITDGGTDEPTTLSRLFWDRGPPIPCRTTRGTDLVVGRQEGETDDVALAEELRDAPQLDQEVVVRDVALRGSGFG